jgi:hypothetical protein
LKLTNKAGLCRSLVDALTAEDYDLISPPANVFSCTTIIDVPRPYFLRVRHEKNITVDVMDNVWLLDGSAVHYAVEMSNKNRGSDRLSEERFFIEVPVFGGEWKVHQLPEKKGSITDQPWYDVSKYYLSVKFDHYDPEEKVIEDYKRTSPWEWVHGIKPARERQLNIGAFALTLAGFQVEKCRVCFFFKDFDKRKAADGGSYPQYPVSQKDLPVWDDSMCKSYIMARMAIFIKSAELPDNELPGCPDEDRWYKPGQMALYKNENKTATKLFDEGDTAGQEAHLAQMKTEYPKATWRWEYRRGTDVRCETYCRGCNFCTYYNTNVKAVGKSEY